MLYKKVQEAINYAKGKSVYEIIERNNIEVREITLNNAYGAIMIGCDVIIYLDSNLAWQCREFVLWHEIGHFLMDGNGEHHFYKHGRSELKTNIFACLMMNGNVNDWIKQGCPINIANNVMDYLSQNVYQRAIDSDVYFY